MEPDHQDPESGELPDDTQAETEVLSNDQYSEYLLHDAREILAVLRQVVDHGDLVTIYFNHGKDFFLTTLLAISESGLFIDRGRDEIMNRRAREADRIFCVTRHDKVKLQFILTGIREERYENSTVFTAALPATLLRLQRREAFRLRTPIMRPLLCNVPTPSVGSDDEQADASTEHQTDHLHVVIDISVGGISLQLADLPLVRGQILPNCVIDLPETGVVTATLEVLNLYETTLKSGMPSQRAGCRFVDLPGSSQNLIQRYIVRTERERKARESGLIR